LGKRTLWHAFLLDNIRTGHLDLEKKACQWKVESVALEKRAYILVRIFARQQDLEKKAYTLVCIFVFLVERFRAGFSVDYSHVMISNSIHGHRTLKAPHPV
jgi:hypothetical protein